MVGAAFEKASRNDDGLLKEGGELTERSSREDLLRFNLDGDPCSSLSSSLSSLTRRGDDERVEGGDDGGRKGAVLAGCEPYVRLMREVMDVEGNRCNAPNTRQIVTRQTCDPVDFVAF